MIKSITVGEKVYSLAATEEDIQKGVASLAAILGHTSSENLLVLGVSEASHPLAKDLHHELGGNLVKARMLLQEEYRATGAAAINPGHQIYVEGFKVVAVGVNLGYPNIHSTLTRRLELLGATDRVEIVSLLRPMETDPDEMQILGHSCLALTGIGHELTGYGLGPRPDLPEIYAWHPGHDAA